MRETCPKQVPSPLHPLLDLERRGLELTAAAGVSAGLDLALALLGEIAGREEAEVAQLRLEYDPHPPFDSGHPSKASEAVREKAAAALAHDARNARNLVSLPKIVWRRAIDRSRAIVQRSA